MPIFTVEGPFTSRQIEEIYHRLMADEYYNEDYNAEQTISEAYETMAGILEKLFGLSSQSKVRDLGCGRAHLVLSLVRRGIHAGGIEFSQRIINAIPSSDRSYVELVNSIHEVALDHVDLLTCMEVFEHLPMSITVENLAHIRRVFSGDLFLTIPSSGYDRTLPRLGHAEADEHRLAAMAANVVCPYLVIEDGYASGGHITLASYRWWEDFFLTQGFARQTARERAYGGFVPELSARGLMWCCYVLKALEREEIAYGRGWHDDEGQFRWSGGDGELQFVSEQDEFHLHCDFTLPDANITLDPRLSFEIEQLDIVDDYRISGRVIASGCIDLTGAGRRRQLSIPILRQALDASPGPYPREDGAIKSFTAYKVRFHTPLWTPARYGDSLDNRTLGFCFQDVRISPVM